MAEEAHHSLAAIHRPTVSAISPSSGTTGGNRPVTITGKNFILGATVKINGVSATDVAVVTSTTIACRTAANNVGTGSVDVTTSNGTNTPNSLYTYSLNGITPPTGAPSRPGVSAPCRLMRSLMTS
jgi:IPT/TIG domain